MAPAPKIRRGGFFVATPTDDEKNKTRGGRPSRNGSVDRLALPGNDQIGSLATVHDPSREGLQPLLPRSLERFSDWGWIAADPCAAEPTVAPAISLQGRCLPTCPSTAG